MSAVWSMISYIKNGTRDPNPESRLLRRVNYIQSYFTTSFASKKKAHSVLAVSGASEP